MDRNQVTFSVVKCKKSLLISVMVTLVFAAVLAGMNQVQGPAKLVWVNGLLALFFALVVLSLFIGFLKQLRENVYSYNTIMFSGFALFLLSMVWIHMYMMVQCIRFPGIFGVRDMLFTLMNAGKNYILLTIPLLVFFSLLLLFSNIVLLVLTKDVFFDHFFGIQLSVLILFGLAFIAVYSWLVHRTGERYLFADLLINLSCAVFLYFECMLFGTGIAGLFAAGAQTERKFDFLIVLGCGLEPDGTPTLLLKKRLNTALKYAREQQQRTGSLPAFIVSGGQGADEVRSEAASMKAYLMENGIPAEKIVLEDRSVNTAENMTFSKAIIDRLKPNAETAFVTTNYHVFRAGVKASEANLKAVGIGAPTTWYYWPNAAVREFVGLIAENRRQQAVVLVGLILFFMALTFLLRA